MFGTFLAQHGLLPWIAAGVCLGLLLANRWRLRGIHHRRFLEIELRLEAALQHTKAAYALMSSRVQDIAPDEMAPGVFENPEFSAVFRRRIQ
jgi:hypothetical protein